MGAITFTPGRVVVTCRRSPDVPLGSDHVSSYWLASVRVIAAAASANPRVLVAGTDDPPAEVTRINGRTDATVAHVITRSPSGEPS